MRGHSINTRGRVCGDSIALSYSQPVSEIDIAIVGERDTSCHLQDTLLVSNQFMNVSSDFTIFVSFLVENFWGRAAM